MKHVEITNVDKISEKNGISFFHVKSDKFKTVRIDIFLVDPLEKKRAVQNALIPHVLKRGCSRFPTQQELALHLEELYGASINAAVSKDGEYQIVHLNAGFVSDQFTVDKTNLFEEVGGILFEILTDPVIEDGIFNRDYFKQERENLIQRIRSRVNNKMYYSLERCMEEMCADEPFAVYKDGDEEGAKALTNQDLMNRYTQLLSQSPIYVYISGNISREQIKKYVDKFNGIERGSILTPPPIKVKKEIKEIRHIEEPMDVSQGKLCLGFRTQIEANDPMYYSLVIYNGILGGGVQSKLFQNVREKESLAYSTFSTIEKFKGLLVACSGIEISQKERAEKTILEQFKAIEDGNISDHELEATKKSLETALKSMQDSQGAMVGFYFSQNLAGQNHNSAHYIESLNAVTKEDVVSVAKSISQDTVYFLTSLSGEGEGEGEGRDK
ncbi:MAG TPA: pitrilysin family protein [Thermoclostridium sp.]|nr:pitrilysin family protein [Thermoclostridium sp.]